jgi:putative DNA primase/helicase
MIKNTRAENYLKGRGIDLPHDIEALRFHPRCHIGANEYAAALLALFTCNRTNAPRALQRIFLTPANTKHEAGKRMLGSVSDASVKLSPDDEVTTGLGICEGVETGLTLIARGWAPVWACGSAGAIAKFGVLDGIEVLNIFADADDSGVGLASARECAERWRAAGREVFIHVPPAGKDWNDLAREIA